MTREDEFVSILQQNTKKLLKICHFLMKTLKKKLQPGKKT